MLERGIDPGAVERCTWSNAIEAYGASGRIDRTELESQPSIDQRALWNDNSVMRGQDPRVDEPVPN